MEGQAVTVRYVLRRGMTVLAIGGSISTHFGAFSVQLMFTQDIHAQNASYGSKGWLGVAYHFK